MTKKLFTLTLALLLFCAPLFSGCDSVENDGVEGSQSNRANKLLEAVTVDWKGEKITIGYSFEPRLSWELVDWYKFDLVFKNSHVRIKMPNGKYMYMKTDGSLIDNEGRGYDYGNDFEEDGTVIVNIQGEVVRIDTDGKVVSEAQFPENPPPFYLGENRYRYVDEKTNLCGLCDADKNPLTDAIFKYFDGVVEGVSVAGLSDGTGVLIDTNGNVQTEFPDAVEGVGLLGSDLIRYQFLDEADNKYYKLYDVSGKCLCNEEFDFIGDFYDGFALVAKDRKIGLIDREGDVLLQPTFEYDEVWGETGTDPVYFLPQYMDENRVIIPINGKIGVLQINRR